MSQPSWRWLQRLEQGSLRKQYRLSVTLLLAVLVVTAAVSACSVLWTSAELREHSEEVSELQLANRQIRQDMTDAEAGIRGFGISREQAALEPYVLAMNWLPQHLQELSALAEEDGALRAAVDRQKDAISSWLNAYAEPRLEQGRSNRDEEATFALGETLFADFRAANQQVEQEIERVNAETRDHQRSHMFIALGMVSLVPLFAVGAVAIAVRRLSRGLVDALGNIAAVQERLRAGDKCARAEVAGPEEIRQIAAGLNLLTEENQRASDIEADVLTQIETIDRVRTDLVSTVSHELRTPLTSIQGYLELLQDDLRNDLTEQQVQMLEAVQRNLDRLNELVTNLLALSLAEETPFAVEPIDLRAVAAEVAADIRLMATGRNISVRALQSAAPVIVLGDRSQLIRAVQNLATNAVKFSRVGGTVELRVVENEATAVLEVVDEGIGIPEEDLPGLGSRFYRATNARRAEIAGTGLGLRIVQTILDRHEGTLAVDSIEGEGTTVTIRLPMSRTLHDPPLGITS